MNPDEMRAGAGQQVLVREQRNPKNEGSLRFLVYEKWLLKH